MRNAAALLRPGGLLVYAVCSPLSEEGPEAVEAAFRDGAVSPAPVAAGSAPPEVAWAAAVAPDPDGWVRLGPWLADAEGRGGGEGAEPASEGGGWREATDSYQIFRGAIDRLPGRG